MPDISLSPEAFIPPYPLHFLTIIRYATLLFIIFIAISPREGGGTTFLLMLGGTALLIVADVYSGDVIASRFAIFMIRVLAVVIPVLMSGSASDKSTRQIAGLVALLGMPGIVIMLVVPTLDPSL